MQTTEHGLPLPKYVQEDSAARQEIVALLELAASKLSELTSETADSGFNRRTERLCIGYLTATEAVHKTKLLVEELDKYDADLALLKAVV